MSLTQNLANMFYKTTKNKPILIGNWAQIEVNGIVQGNGRIHIKKGDLSYAKRSQSIQVIRDSVSLPFPQAVISTNTAYANGAHTASAKNISISPLAFHQQRQITPQSQSGYTSNSQQPTDDEIKKHFHLPLGMIMTNEQRQNLLADMRAISSTNIQNTPQTYKPVPVASAPFQKPSLTTFDPYLSSLKPIKALSASGAVNSELNDFVWCHTVSKELATQLNLQITHPHTFVGGAQNDVFLPGNTPLGGHFGGGTVTVSIPATGSLIEVGSKHAPRAPPHNPIQKYAENQSNGILDLREVEIDGNTKQTRIQNPQKNFIYKIQEKLWKEEQARAQFEQDIASYIYVYSQNQGKATFQKVTGQHLFTVSPALLLEWVRKRSLIITGKLSIADNNNTEYPDLVQLHKNTKGLHDFFRQSASKATQDKSTEPKNLHELVRRSPESNPFLDKFAKETPCLWYESLVNEQGEIELSPILYIPTNKHKTGVVKAETLIIIPDNIDISKLYGPLAEFINEYPKESLPLVQGLSSSALLPLPAGTTPQALVAASSPFPTQVHLNGDIQIRNLNIAAPGDVSIEGEHKYDNAQIISLYGDVKAKSLIKRTDSQGRISLLLYGSHTEETSQDSFTDSVSSEFDGDFTDELVQTSLTAKEVLALIAGRDVNMKAVAIKSGVLTYISARRNIIEEAITLASRKTETLNNGFQGQKTIETTTSIQNNHGGTGKKAFHCGGKHYAEGSTYNGKSLSFTANGGHDFRAIADRKIVKEHGTKSGFWSDETHDKYEATSSSKGCVFKSINDKVITFTSQNGDIKLYAPTFLSTAGVDLNTPNNKVYLLAALNKYVKSEVFSSEGFFWNVMDRVEQQDVTHTTATSTGPVRANAKKTIVDVVNGQASIDLQDESGAPLLVNVSHPAPLLGENQTRAISDNVMIRVLEDIHKYDHEHNESLGGPVSTILSMSVGLLTLQPFTSFMSTTVGLGTISSTMAGAGLSALASKSAVSFISNQGDIGAVFEDLASSDTLKSVAFSMISAGLTKGIASKLKIDMASSAELGKALDLKTRIQQACISGGVNTVLKLADGEDVGDALTSALQNATFQVVQGVVAEKIGTWYHGPKNAPASHAAAGTPSTTSSINLSPAESDSFNAAITSVVHKIMHGVSAAGISALTGHDALSGAIGAIVGEIVGESYAKEFHEDLSQGPPSTEPTGDPIIDAANIKKDQYYQNIIHNGSVIAQISAAIAATAVKGDANHAANTANIVVNENSFTLNRTLQPYTIGTVVNDLQEALQTSNINSFEQLTDLIGGVLASHQTDLTDSQRETAALQLAKRLNQSTTKDVSPQNLKTYVHETFLEVAGPTAEFNEFVDTSSELGKKGGTWLADQGDMSDPHKEIMGKLGEKAAQGAALYLGFVDNPFNASAKQGAKKIVKEIAKKEAATTIKTTAKQNVEIVAKKETKAKSTAKPSKKSQATKPKTNKEKESTRKSNLPKAQSPVWNNLKHYRGSIKTNGQTRRKKQYYEWDYLHNEIEVYDWRGKPVDAIDPKTGLRLNKCVKDHKPLDL